MTMFGMPHYIGCNCIYCVQTYGVSRAISSLPESPPIISDLITYRCWNINRYELLTSPFIAGTVWFPHQTFEAHNINDDLYGGGIYSFKSLSSAYAYHPATVVGSVQIWGQVIEHEKGYRSQFAKIHSIISVAKEDKFSIKNWIANRQLLKFLRSRYLGDWKD